MKLVLNHWVSGARRGPRGDDPARRAARRRPARFLEIIEGGPMFAPYAKLKGDEDDRALLRAELLARAGARKDAGLIAEAAARGLDLPLAELDPRAMQMAVDAGHGDEDMAAAVEAGRQRARRRSSSSTSRTTSRPGGALAVPDGDEIAGRHQRARRLRRLRPRRRHARLAPARPRLVRRAGRPVAGALRRRHAGRRAAPGARPARDRRGRRQGPGPGHRGLLGLRGHATWTSCCASAASTR